MSKEESVAKILLGCVLDKLKKKGIEKALEDIEDPVLKALLEKGLDKVLLDKIEGDKTIYELDFKCDEHGPRIQLHFKMTFKLNGQDIQLEHPADLQCKCKTPYQAIRSYCCGCPAKK